jgi:sugar lactone lactonase YvrE
MRAGEPAAGNELVVDGRGNAYVNGGQPLGVGPATGIIALVRPDGLARRVAEGLAFPNGLLIMPDGRTLVVAESYARRLTAFEITSDGSLSDRRVWADLGDGVPDGICADADDAIWYADVPNKRCVRAREGGEVLQTVELDRGCFACALGGADRTTLFMTANLWHGPGGMFDGTAGQVLATSAPAPGAGRP